MDELAAALVAALLSINYFSDSVSGIATIVAIVILAGLAIRGRWGSLWKATAEEAQARVRELETQRHDLLAENSALKARPDVQKLYSLMEHHDERMSTAALHLDELHTKQMAVLAEMLVLLKEIRRGESAVDILGKS